EAVTRGLRRVAAAHDAVRYMVGAAYTRNLPDRMQVLPDSAESSEVCPCGAIVKRHRMDELKNAVRSYALRHADHDGLARTPISGFEMMCVDTPRGDLQAVYRPLVCVVLQGAKRMTVGRECRTITAGESVIVSADMPVVGRVVQASMAAPYMAVAVHLQLALIAEMAVQLDHSGAGPGRAAAAPNARTRKPFSPRTPVHLFWTASRV